MTKVSLSYKFYESYVIDMADVSIASINFQTKEQVQLLFMQYTIARKFYLDKSLEQKREWNMFMYGTDAPHFPFFKNDGDIDYNYFSYNGTVFNMS